MSFSTRDEFINAQSSEKLILAQVEATGRLVAWTDQGGGIYTKTSPHFVTAVSFNTAAMAQVDTVVNEGEFSFDPQTNLITIRNTGDADPAVNDMVITYRFFFGSGPATASWDLTDTGAQVLYEGRIERSPGYKHKIGIDQNLTSLVGSGNLVLNNNDGRFDDLFDTVYFENQRIFIYSWNRDLDFSDAKILFKGRTTNKTFSNSSISLTVKDTIFDLQQNIPQGVFSSSDNVNNSVQGNYKRWVYGRVDGLRLQSVDQIGDGYAVTGTFEGNTTTTTLTGTGTSFLSELSPEDILTIGTQEFTIESIASDTSLTVSDEPTFAFTGQSATVVPAIPTTTQNREFFVTDHAGAELSKTVASVLQFNRVQLSDVDGLLAGDIIEFAGGERVEIKSFAPNNVVVLQQNLIALPAVSSTVTRQPIQSIFVEGNLVQADNFTINNSSAELTLTLDSDVEFNLAPITALPLSLTFTNGSRTITFAGSEDLTSFIGPRDFIRPANIAYTTFYEVLEVTESTITLRTAFADPNITDTGSIKQPNYVGDNTIISANVLGRTVDGTPAGTWISTTPQAIKDALNAIGITDLNETSFTDGTVDSPQIISLAIPLSPGSSATTVKDTVDRLNNSVKSSVTLDNDLNIKYKSLLAKIPDDVPVLTDKEITGWKVTATNGNIFRNSIVRYRHTDIDRFTLESGTSVVTYTSDFVQKYIKTDKTGEVDAYIYEQTAAEIRSHREVYYSRLSRAEISVDGDLRLDTYEIGDVVKLSFRRLYKRLGDSTSGEKVLTIIGKTVDGEKVTLSMSDLGNIYNTSSIITPNTAANFTGSTSEERIKRGYVTDEEGIINNSDETANIHLIN